ncbi:Protein archease [Methanocorpusculaceae archaeon Sp1]|nr:Protein archease [Methanocorpusculaceae archaeon Sp1]
MTFEELDHTADVRMKISAPTLTELYIESGFALAATLYGEYSHEKGEVSFPIEAEGKDAEETFVNFLSELLFLTETEYLVPTSFDLAVCETTVSGNVSGVLFDRKKHAGGIGVKGISYSGISFEKNAHGYELIIIFDI